MTRERRRLPRRDVGLPAELHVAGRAWPAHLHDICRDAALVEADQPLAPGARVELAFTLPGLRTPIRIEGRVIRNADGELHPHALAVLFEEITAGDAERIDFFVALLDEEQEEQGAP